MEMQVSGLILRWLFNLAAIRELGDGQAQQLRVRQLCCVSKNQLMSIVLIFLSSLWVRIWLLIYYISGIFILVGMESEVDPQEYWSRWTEDKAVKYSIFQKDFIHDKILRFNISLKSQEKSFMRYQQVFTQKQAKIDIINSVKLWFSFRNNNKMVARLQPNLYEWGYYRNDAQFKGNHFNFYCSIQHNQSFAEKIYKIGVKSFKDNYRNDLRLQYKHEESSLIFQKKTEIKDRDWRYRSFISYDIMNQVQRNFQFQIANLNVAQGNAVYLTNKSKRETPIHLKNIFHQIIFEYIHKANQENTLGLQGVFNVQKRKFVLGSVWEHVFDRLEGEESEILKIKFDLQRNVCLSIKNRIEGLGWYIYGLRMSDFGRTNKLNYGLSINFNF